MTQSMPRLFPFIAARFQTKRNTVNNTEHVVKGHSNWILAMQRLVHGGLSPSSQVPLSITQLYLPFGDDMVIPLIVDMGAIVQLCHEHGTGFSGIDRDLLKKRFGVLGASSYGKKIAGVTKAFNSVAKNVYAFHRYRNNQSTYGIKVQFEGEEEPKFVGPPAPKPAVQEEPATRGRGARGRGRGRGRVARGGVGTSPSAARGRSRRQRTSIVDTTAGVESPANAAPADNSRGRGRQSKRGRR